MEDGRALNEAFQALSTHVFGDGWTQYLTSVEKLNNALRQVVAGNQIYTKSQGVPYGIWEFCLECTDQSAVGIRFDSKLNRVFGIIGRMDFLNLTGGLQQVSSWRKNGEAIAPLLSGGGMLVYYSSLPEALRKSVGLGNLERLTELGAGRLYAIINIKQSRLASAEPFISDPCDDIMTGQSCRNAVAFGSFEIVFTTGPFETEEYTRSTASTELGKKLLISTIFRFDSFPIRQKHTVFNLDFEMPVKAAYSGGTTGLFSTYQPPSLAGFLAYAKRYLAQPEVYKRLSPTGYAATINRSLVQHRSKNRKLCKIWFVPLG